MQVGRAGRDGAPALCETFVARADLPLLRSMIYGSTPSPRAVIGLVNMVFDGDEDEADLNLYDVSQVQLSIGIRLLDQLAAGVNVEYGGAPVILMPLFDNKTCTMGRRRLFQTYGKQSFADTAKRRTSCDLQPSFRSWIRKTWFSRRCLHTFRSVAWCGR